MQETFPGKILGVSDQVSDFLRGLNVLFHPLAVLDIIIVAALIYFVYIFLRETRALRILYGIAVLAVIFLLGQLLELQALNFLLRHFLTLILVAIPVVFQPELRAALERLGRSRLVSEFTGLKKFEIKDVVSKILEAVKALSKNKTGALIVLARLSGLREFVETGTTLDARLSPELLLNIFSPKAPLHDGAVIISGNKIIAAGATLPLSEELKYDTELGTRHKAALGLASQTDAVIIIVSEENGQVSLALEGKIYRSLSPKELEERLLHLLKKTNKE